jgi:hypothetical protein
LVTPSPLTFLLLLEVGVVAMVRQGQTVPLPVAVQAVIVNLLASL